MFNRQKVSFQTSLKITFMPFVDDKAIFLLRLNFNLTMLFFFKVMAKSI